MRLHFKYIGLYDKAGNEPMPRVDSGEWDYTPKGIANTSTISFPPMDDEHEIVGGAFFLDADKGPEMMVFRLNASIRTGPDVTLQFAPGYLDIGNEEFPEWTSD